MNFSQNSDKDVAKVTPIVQTQHIQERRETPTSSTNNSIILD